MTRMVWHGCLIAGLGLLICHESCAPPRYSREPPPGWSGPSPPPERMPLAEPATPTAAVGTEVHEAESVDSTKPEPRPVDRSDDASRTGTSHPGPTKDGFRPAPASPGVQAGHHDDNQAFNPFLEFLDQYQALPHLAVDVRNRLRFTLRDGQGRSVINCPVRFLDPRGRVIQERRSYADGRVMLFPSEDPALQEQGLKLEADCLGEQQRLALDPRGPRELELKFRGTRPALPAVPLDVVFLLDTTGSMGDELARLRQTLEVIHFQIANLPSRPAVRFGMVLYRDRGDAYVTRSVPLTADVEGFRRTLEQVAADGGGDTPEDLQAGLQEALQRQPWRDGQGVRLLFLLADAPPHLDYADQSFTYREAMREAARRAIKIVSIGASGLPTEGELVFRQLAQYTQGLFVFLTYGEQGESDGGTSTSVSHHTGANWHSQDLDAIVVQMVKRELAHLAEQPPAPGEDYYETTRQVPADQRDAVLGELCDRGVEQLRKYSTLALEPRTPTTVLPVATPDPQLKAAAELLEDRILLALGRVPSFQVVERQDAQQLLAELKRSGSDLFDSEQSVKIGRLVGAQLTVISRLTPKVDRLELFLKLVRVETGEVLSMALLKLDPALVR